MVRYPNWDKEHAPTGPCILCGAPATDDHHFPHTRRYGDATVPLCRSCHTAAHWGRLTEQLIEKAPRYWSRMGTYELYAEEFETWLSKRRYVAMVSR